MWVESVVLEDHCDVTVLWRNVGDVAVANEDCAFVDLFEAGEHAQGGRLATARRTNENQELAIGDVKVDLVDGWAVATWVKAGCLAECY